MVESILAVLGAALSIWDHKEKTKYVDKYMSLKKDYHEEYSKPVFERSDAVLDDIEFQLRLLCSGFATAVGTSDPTPKPGPAVV